MPYNYGSRSSFHGFNQSDFHSSGGSYYKEGRTYSSKSDYQQHKSSQRHLERKRQTAKARAHVYKEKVKKQQQKLQSLRKKRKELQEPDNRRAAHKAAGRKGTVLTRSRELGAANIKRRTLLGGG